jgi:hypothetical protein
LEALQIGERCRSVTLIALVAELAAMHVIGPMTAGAARREVDLGEHVDGLTMTPVTVEPVMCAIQWEIRLGIMVETPRQPVHGHVAECAFLAEPRSVHVVLEVAVHALFGRIEEGVALVAILAFSAAMDAQ